MDASMLMTTNDAPRFANVDLLGHQSFRPCLVWPARVAGVDLLAMLYPRFDFEAGEPKLTIQYVGRGSVYALEPLADDQVKASNEDFFDKAVPLREWVATHHAGRRSDDALLEHTPEEFASLPAKALWLERVLLVACRRADVYLPKDVGEKISGLLGAIVPKS